MTRVRAAAVQFLFAVLGGCPSPDSALRCAFAWRCESLRAQYDLAAQLCRDSSLLPDISGRGAARLARLVRDQEVGGSNPLAPTDCIGVSSDESVEETPFCACLRANSPAPLHSAGLRPLIPPPKQFPPAHRTWLHTTSGDCSMALTITGLSKTYPNGVRALKNLSLTVGNNMFGLLGPNGAGKSSLMRTIATLQDPDSGTITLDGIDVLTQKDEVRKCSATCRRNSACIRRCPPSTCSTISRF